MKRLGTLLGLSLALGLAAGASAGNLVKNGDFSSPGVASAVWLGYVSGASSTFVTNWTIEDQYAAYIPAGQTPDQYWSGVLTGSAGPGYGVANGLVGPPGGGAQVVLDGTNGFGPGGAGTYGYIYQDGLALVSGQKYTLTFWQAGSQEYFASGDQTEFFVASVGDLGFDSPTMTVLSQGFSPWEKVTWSFVYDGSGNTLSFTSIGSGVPPFAMLADVSLTGGVPELSTWGMIIAGFAGIVVAARIRSKRVVAIAA